MPEPLPWDQFANNHPATPGSSDRVVIIGAGLAGCWMARTLAEAGVRVIVLEKGECAASGASKNPAGIAKPFVTRSPCLAMNFHVEAHRYLKERLRAWNLVEACGFTACGVAQLVDKPYPASDHYDTLAPEQMHDVLGVDTDANAILFAQAGWLNPAALCHALLGHELINLQCNCAMTSLSRIQTESVQWEVGLKHQDSLIASHVVICSGVSLSGVPISSTLTITPARGQISRFEITADSAKLKSVVSAKHYVIPDGGTVLVGATFTRGDNHSNLRPDDDRSNRAGLEGALPALNVQPVAVEAYAGVRATTPDRLPLVGPLPDVDQCATAYADLRHGRNMSTYPMLPVHAGAYVLGGLGSRGIVTAPLAAQLLSNLMLGGTDIDTWSSLINPARFQVRALKRGE